MKYQNISDSEQMIPHIGLVKSKETIETSETINNSNFKLIEGVALSEAKPEVKPLPNSDQK